jgi:hypothetical protein
MGFGTLLDNSQPKKRFFAVSRGVRCGYGGMSGR